MQKYPAPTCSVKNWFVAAFRSLPSHPKQTLSKRLPQSPDTKLGWLAAVQTPSSCSGSSCFGFLFRIEFEPLYFPSTQQTTGGGLNMSPKLGICTGFLFILFQLMLAADATGQSERRVGPYGDISRIAFRGLRTFTDDDVRDSLRYDSGAILAAHPLAPLSQFPNAIDQRLLAGFRRAGFIDAEVQSEIDFKQTRLVATIHQGPRISQRSGAGSWRQANQRQFTKRPLGSTISDRRRSDSSVQPKYARSR